MAKNTSEPVDPRRSALMCRVRGKNSRPELAARKAAHALGFRYRLHRRDLPGSPDLVFPRLKKVIFVHGCFWHRHEGCSRTTNPKTRAEYWTSKFAANMNRDSRVEAALKEAGWEVLILWECQTFDPHGLSQLLRKFLRRRGRRTSHSAHR